MPDPRRPSGFQLQLTPPVPENRKVFQGSEQMRTGSLLLNNLQDNHVMNTLGQRRVK